MSRTKASMINSSVRNSLISPEASWQRLCLMTECRAGERRPNRERESCINSQQKETRKPFFPLMKRKKKKKITRVVKSGCICSAAEDLSSSFLVGEADSRREQDRKKSWSGLRIPGACLGQPKGNLSQRPGQVMVWWPGVGLGLQCQTSRHAHLQREENPKSPLQKQFWSCSSEAVPRFNQRRQRKIFLLHLL